MLLVNDCGYSCVWVTDQMSVHVGPWTFDDRVTWFLFQGPQLSVLHTPSFTMPVHWHCKCKFLCSISLFYTHITTWVWNILVVKRFGSCAYNHLRCILNPFFVLPYFLSVTVNKCKMTKNIFKKLLKWLCWYPYIMGLKLYNNKDYSHCRSVILDRTLGDLSFTDICSHAEGGNVWTGHELFTIITTTPMITTGAKSWFQLNKVSEFFWKKTMNATDKWAEQKERRANISLLRVYCVDVTMFTCLLLMIH